MVKPISRMQHGIADWLLIPVVAASPYLVGFADVANARILAWCCAGAILMTVVCTRAEWGLLRIIPYRAHLMLDAGLGAVSLILPWLFGFAHIPAARNTFLALGALVLVASLVLSRPEEMPAGRAVVGPSLET